METLARISGVSLDFETGKPILHLMLADRSKLETLGELKESLLRVVIEKHRKKRSLSANNYFHALCGQIAHALSISEARCKNILIGRYGFVQYVDEERKIPYGVKSNIPPEIMLEQETHWRLIKGGGDLWMYVAMRGSSTYNTEEFSRLLDGTIAEAKELGIDTITRSERDKMLERWANEKRVI